MAQAVTIKGMLVQTCRDCPDSVALRFKRDGRWQTLAYSGLLSNSRAVSSLLCSRGTRIGERVGIFLENCPEWPEIYFGIVCAGMTAVPMDAKLREQEVSHILRDAGCRTVFLSSRTYRVFRETEAALPHIARAVVINMNEIEPVAAGRIEHLDYAESLAAAATQKGDRHAGFDRHDPTGDETASIIYTSGTTGLQKGAMLTHRNFCANVNSCIGAIHIKPSDNFLMVLPLHHAFSFTVNLLIPVAIGAQISFVENLKTIGENIREVSPTVLVAVPLLVEKIYTRIMDGLRRKRAVYWLFKSGLRAPVRRGIIKKLGGRLRMVVVGGAPTPVDVLNGLSHLGIPILEGYGLTETSPVLTFNPPEKPKPGTVGKAIPDVEIRISDPDGAGVGEITARGPNVMAGYFNKPRETETVLRDGWFHTGDLGSLDQDGYLVISGRKKNLIVNREGKNIYPEEVEDCIVKSPLILEAVVFGYREAGETGERVGLIVVPDQDGLDAWTARKKKLPSDEEIAELIRAEVRKCVASIAEYKRPRRIQIRTEEFEKTATGKIKRYLYAISPTEI